MLTCRFFCNLFLFSSTQLLIMRKAILFLISLLAFSYSLLADPDPKQWLAKQQVSFTENKGQIADKGKIRKDIFYIAQSKGVKIYFTRTGLIYNYIQTEETFFKKPDSETEKDKIRKEHPEQVHRKSKAYGMELLFVNASEKVIIKSEDETGETSNYYLPQCPDGITNVKSYRKITYQNLYPEIDLVFYSSEQGMKYDFIVKPGGNIADIQLKYKDVQHLKLLKDGSLQIKNPLGTLTEGKPFTYQNDKQEIKSNYKLKGKTLSFEVNNYDKTKNLTIDPSIVWATYYGGSNYDYGNAVATDKDGNVYLAGYTESSSGIASGGFQNTYGGNADAFLVKFSASGQRLWATYYGGNNGGSGSAVATDKDGNVYLAGTTGSTNGIASSGFQNTLGANYDAFLVKFSSSGQRLWATYYGGTGYDFGSTVASDKDGNVYLAGYTESSSGIASGGFQNTIDNYGNNDAFLVKFSSFGQRLWATYYGGSGEDVGRAVTIDKDGNVYLAGQTISSQGIASGGFQNSFGGFNDAFLVKFSSFGQRLWATYYGGNDFDDGCGVAVDKVGNVYLTGVTRSSSGIASGGFQNTFIGNNDDAFLVKFSSSGQRLWATYFGGNRDDYGNAVAADKDGNVYLTGYTGSSSGIASGGFQNTIGGGTQDAFLVKFSSSGQRLWATYYGGSSEDNGNAVTADKDGNVYLAGYTNSSSGIASGGFQNTLGGNIDAFLAKISDKVPANFISGILYNDSNANCIKDANEKPLPGLLIKAEPDGYFGISDSLGNYSIPVGIGSYTVRQITPDKKGIILTQVCPTNPVTYSVQFAANGNTVTGKDFADQVNLCAFLQTNISSNRRRRCFLNYTTVSYSNSGFAKAENVKVFVKMPDNVLLKKADKAFTIDKDGNYVFTIGTLDVNQSGVINIADSVVCKAGITGLTACTKAWITPANNCTPPKTTWDKSDIVLSGKCIDNGFVRIVLKNTGEGSMADSSQLRILLDAQLALKKGFKINKGDSLVVKIPANGRTVRLEADERPDHPRKSQTSITFEGCTATLADVVSKGFVNQLPQDDTEPEVSIQCLPIRDSYDPNDKQVLPVGTTAQHFTPTDAELQYQIRFQNTGTDTAYTVTVIDTLSDNLDIATLQIGAASHKYQFNVSGKGKPVLTWTFNNINLPDSTKDKLKSNGFISFSIKAKTGLAAQTKIENYADIIFDFNDPVRTNTTFNVMYDVPPVVVSAVKLDEKAVIPLPVITSFTPLKAKVGETVTIKGKNFEKNLVDNILKINEVPAVIESVNDSILVFKVPASALSGKINLKTNYGLAASSTDFIVLYPPVIASFSPDKGIPGDKITITGSNFDVIAANNTVKFGSLSAQVLSANATTLEVKVPSGFYQAKVAVTTPVGNTVSTADFTMLLTATENQPENSFTLYPNPTDGKIMIDFGSQPVKVLEISVLNSIGSPVLLKKVQKVIQKEEVDLSDKPAGIYLLLLKTETGSLSRKVVIR